MSHSAPDLSEGYLAGDIGKGDHKDDRRPLSLIVVRLRNVIKTVIRLSVNRGLENGYAPTPSHAATPLSPTVVLDTHPGLPIHLPSDNTLSQIVEKLTVSFSLFGILSHGIEGDDRRVVIKRLR